MTINLSFQIFHISTYQKIWLPHTQTNIYPNFNLLNYALLLQEEGAAEAWLSCEYS
jgi:hypothetical protein